MPALRREHIIEIPEAVQTFRWLAATTYGRLLPFEIRDIPLDGKAEAGLFTARKMVYRGNGLIVAHTHANKGDSPRVVKMLYTDPVISTREFVIPIAIHQVKPWQSIVADLLCSPNLPVVTKETQKVFQGRGLPQIPREETKSIMDGYISQGVDTLQRGGIAVIAPQGTRQPFLGELTSAISLLVGRSVRENVDNLAILFIGAEIPEGKIAKLNSINHGLLYRLNIGNCFSLKRLLEEAEGRLRNVDNVVRRELASLVHPNYLVSK